MQLRVNLPRQDIPENEKTPKWCSQHLDFATYILTQRNHYYNKKLTEYFNQYNGLSNANAFKFITEAYGKKNRTKFIDYRLGKTKIDLLNGEFLTSPISASVFTINSEAISEKEQNYLMMVGASLAKKELAILKKNGLDVSKEMDVPDIDDKEGWEKMNFKNEHEAIMQIIINETLLSDETKTKFANNFMDIELASMCWGKIFMRENGEAGYRDIDIRDAIFIELDKDPYIKRSPIRGERRRMTVAEILNEFELNEEQRNKIYYIQANKSNYLNGDYGRYSPFSMDNGEFTVDVINIEWDSVRPIMTKNIPSKKSEGVVYKQDMIIEKYLEDRVVFDKKFAKDNIQVVTQYKQELWVATRIGLDIDIECKRAEYQMFLEDDPSRLVGGQYTGMLFNTVNGTRVPLSETIDNLSRMYNVCMYQINRELAKFHGNMLGFDEAFLPKGKSMHEVLYEAVNDGLIRHNSAVTGNISASSPGIRKIIEQLDIGFSSSFSMLLQLKQDIMMTLDSLTGINNDRQGQTKASSTVTNAQENISASRSITAPMFYMMEKHIEIVLTRMAEMTKMQIAYKGSKKWESVLGSAKYNFLKLNPEIVKYNFGVHVGDSNKENKLRKRMEQIAEYALNNKEVRPFDLLEAEAQESISDAIGVLKKGWATVQKLNAQQQQAAGEQQMQLEAQKADAALKQFTENREDVQAHEVELAKIKKGLDVIQDSLKAKNEFTNNMAISQNETLNQGPAGPTA